jgi:hypothetical protein
VANFWMPLRGSRKVPLMVLPWIRTSWTWRCSTARTKSE